MENGSMDDHNIPSTGKPSRTTKPINQKRLTNILLGKPHRTWDGVLPSIMFAIRNRKNQNTGHSPTESVLGKKAKAPGDWFFQRGRSQEEIPGTGKPLTEQTPRQTGSPRHKVGDWVYYRNHPHSKGDQGFHTGFTPK